MVDHKSNSDILGELLRAAEVDTDHDDAEPLAELIHRAAELYLDSVEENISGPQAPIDEVAPVLLPKKPTRKTTIYLSEDMRRALLLAKSKVNVIAEESGQGGQASMSWIVNQALKIVLDELQDKGEESVLAKILKGESPKP